MTIIESSIKINASVEKVFAYITDIEKQMKTSQYVTGVDIQGPLQVGTRYVVKTNTMGRTIETVNEIIAFEPNKKWSVKTFGTPPASDLVNTTLLESDGGSTKVTAQMDAVLMPAGMPNMPGMEDMMKKQMIAGMDTALAALKKALEG
jgi:carbon monoxide dehydrogenase subunit G